MTDPTTTNLGLAIPTRGSDSGAWDVPLNGNASTLDLLATGTTTKSLTNANVTLSLTEQNVSRILVTGTLTGNCDLLFSRPGEWVLDNQCTVGAFYVRLSKADGTGNKIGAPPGRKCRVYFDGTGFDYVDLPPTGSYWDYAGGTTPAWITACTVAPWLVCDGSTPLIATYPQLAAILGTTYGGNGINTFGLPDLISRSRIMLDTAGKNRVTAAGSGINGASLSAAGGDQLMQQHNHTIVDNGHSHEEQNRAGGILAGTGGGTALGSGPGGTPHVLTSTDTTGISINNAGTGGSQNMPPTIVAGLTFMKT